MGVVEGMGRASCRHCELCCGISTGHRGIENRGVRGEIVPKKLPALLPHYKELIPLGKMGRMFWRGCGIK